MADVVIVAAHPDDEVLGCGGTIARHVNYNDDVHIIFMTNGVSSRGENLQAIKNRQLAMNKSMSSLGVKSFYNFDYPDNKMDSIPLLDAVQSIENVFKKINPSVIYTHYFGDLNIDHQITYKAVMTASRPQPNNSIKEIYCFEVPSSTDWLGTPQSIFHPNHFVDITKYWQLKEIALNNYSIEMRDYPHFRSFEAIDILSKFRGSSCGLFRAEAFILIRKIVI